MTTIATVTGLFVYPVKSSRAIAKSRVRVTWTGFEWDRQWMVIDGKGTFLSQRTHPQLARIVPEVTSNALVLTAPDLPPLQLPLTSDGERVAVRVHRHPCVGLDQGRAASEWVSRALGEAVRLVRVPPNTERRADPAFAGTVPAPMGFADGYPVLVVNQSSLDDLNERMPEAIPMERFRPNIVLEGLPAWAEDRIDTINVGDLTLRLVKPCTRCTIPAVDQQTGLPSTDPGPVLKQFRFSKELLGVCFGENAVIAAGTGCQIERGAPCHVTFEPAAARPS
jgi:uncharacterized protein YcbX